MKRFVLILYSMLLLTACSRPHAEISETAGAGRVIPTKNPETETEITETDALPSLTRDTSGLSDLSDLTAVYGVPFPDAGNNNDWFFGKTTRDPQTGDVTYVWERSQDTLDLLEKYNAVYRGDETRKVCYLTFDCGYETGTMPTILDTLQEKEVPATFFVNGHYVESAQDMILRMVEEGHIVANHCVNHYDLTEVDANTFIAEVQGLEDMFTAGFPDAEPMLYFRPPSGSTNEWVLKLADKMGYTTVLWSWAYYDYDDANQPPVDETLEKVKLGLHPGAVFLLHPESTTNTSMLGDMIDWIRSVGYEILPICDIT